MRMSWREYQLRREGFLRQQRERWYHTREVAYASLMGGGAYDPKKLSKQQFMPIDDEVGNLVKVSDEHRAVFYELQAEYENEVKKKQCQQN